MNEENMDPDCYQEPGPAPPPEYGGISDLMMRYNGLKGEGVRKNW